MNKLKNMIFVILAVSLITQVNVIDSSAGTLGKTSITSVKQVGKKAVNLTWKKISGAKGYEVQYRSGGNSWKSKVTQKNKICITGLNMDETYQFRIRAYKTENGKKKYGKYSVLKKITIHDYIYLIDLYQPYHSSYYEAYDNGKYFFMGGSKQKNGFILGQNYWGVEKNADFNIEGKYKSISFNVGKVDDASDSPTDGDLDVNIYSDGILIDTIKVEIDALPQRVNMQLDYTERLTFEVETGACTLVGISNLKLYYR